MSSGQTGQRRFVAISLAIYTAVILLAVWRHEPWRDEADPWLAARDMTPAQLFHWCHYLGSPGLFHLLLMIPAKLGLPYFSGQVLHALLTVVTAGLILAFAPFPRPVRVLVIFSYALAFEFAIVMRTYALGNLLLIGACALFPRRFGRPLLIGLLIALLFNTSVHDFIIAGAMLAVIGIDAILHKKLAWPVVAGGAIACLGAVIAFAQLFPQPPDQQLTGWTLRSPQAPLYVLMRLGQPLIPADYAKILASAHGHALIAGVIYAGVWAMGIAVVIAAVSLLRRNPRAMAFVCVAVGGLMFVYIFKFYGGPRHAAIVWVVGLAGIWVALAAEEQPPTQSASPVNRWAPAILTFALVVSCCMTALEYVRDWRYQFSGSTAAADFLLSHGLADDPLVMFRDCEGSAILPYLPHAKVWYLGEEREGTYMVWNAKCEAAEHLTLPQVLPGLSRQLLDQRPTLVFTEPWATAADSGYELVFHNQGYIYLHFDESYYIYQPLAQASLQ